MARAPAKAKTSARFHADMRMVLLTGVEAMLKSQYLDELRKALHKEHGELQETIFDGKAITLAEVLDELRTFSMLQQYKLVIVDQADQFVKETTRPSLERYAQSPVDNATLVLRSDKWHAGKLDKLIDKIGVRIKCEPLKPAEAEKWLMQRSELVHGRKLDTRAARALVQRLGTSLHQLDSELAKLVVMVEPTQPIDVKLIDAVVGRAGDEAAYVVQEGILQALTQRAERMSPAGAAIVSLHELVEVSKQPKELVAYFVSDLMRKLCLASMLKRQGANDFAIGKELRLWGGREKALLQMLRQVGPDGAGRAFDRAIAADARSKRGLGETMQNLEGLCVQLADEIK